MSVLAAIAERKIQEALARGELDNLTLKGEPLPVEDLTFVPEELRMGFKVLRNAGVLPEELQARRELVNLQGLLDACRDEEERERLRRRLTLQRLRYDMLMERHGHTAAWRQYESAIAERLGG